MRCGDFRETYREDMAIFETNFARGALVLFLSRSALAPAFLSYFWMDVLNRILIAVIAATGLNILTGFTGQNLARERGVPRGRRVLDRVLRGAPRAAVPRRDPARRPDRRALVGMVFGVPSLRLKGLYLAVATLAAHFVVEFTASHWDGVTGGVNGISVPGRSSAASS